MIKKMGFRSISISNIVLDQKNPRFVPVKNQREAILAMLNEQGDKLYKLAEDIVLYGLNPSRRFIVFEDGNRFVDGDGNRRMTALKILETPDLIKGHKLHKKFKKILEKYDTQIDKVDCVVFSSRKNIKHWLEIEHEGELDGKGKVNWDSVQKDRFLSVKSIGMQAIDSLIKTGDISSVEASKMNKTTFDRLLKSSVGKKALGITKDNSGTYKFSDKKNLKTVFDNLKGKKTVTKVYHKKDQQKFLNDCLGITQSTNDEKQKTDTPKRTRRRNSFDEEIFGERLYLKKGGVNDLYLDICDIDDLRRKDSNKERYAEILGFSLRLILDVAAREYFKDDNKKDNLYKKYLKVLKNKSLQKDKNTLSVDSGTKKILEAENVEAFLGKFAHGSICVSMSSVIHLSQIIAKILKIHFSRSEV